MTGPIVVTKWYPHDVPASVVVVAQPDSYRVERGGCVKCFLPVEVLSHPLRGTAPPVPLHCGAHEP